ARGWLRTDPRFRSRAWSTGLLGVGAVAAGLTSALAVDLPDDPDDVLIPLLLMAATLVLMIGTVVWVLATDRWSERRRPLKDTGSPLSDPDSWQTYTLFRLFWGSCVLAALLVLGADPTPDWWLRAALGVPGCLAYGWYLRRVRRTRVRPLGRGWRAARWLFTPLSVGWLVNVVAVVALTVLPDGWLAPVAGWVVLPVMLIMLGVVIQFGRLVAWVVRLFGRVVGRSMPRGRETP
ncbi:MAG: hypothetical protein WCA46_12075, partial [Actinocatenispora sp.]